MEQTEVNDWLSVFTVLVEPLRGVAIVGAFTLRALIALQLNSDFLEAVLGDEDGEEPIGPVAILPNNGFAAVRTGPRVSDPLALKSSKPVMNRVNQTERYEAVQRLFFRFMRN